MTPPAQCPLPTEGTRCRLAEDAARVGGREMARELLATIYGVDIDDPKAVADLQDDLRAWRFLRRQLSEGAADARRTAVRIGVTTFLVIIGYGIIEWLKRHW